MKQKLLFLLTALLLLTTSNAWATETELAPVGVFTWTNAPAITYDGEATSWAINQGGVSGGNIGRYAGPYAIIKFDASTILEGMTLISATLDFDITAGAYNSSINIAQMSVASFTPSTVTTATFNTSATQFQSGDWSTKNSTTHFSYDVKARVEDNNILAFAIYTNTAREQTLKNVKLKLNYSADAANYTVKYVSTIADVETEIKSHVVRTGVIDATVTLEASDKNSITYGGHQYYYVSDNASSSTIANDNSTVVKVVFAQAAFNGDYYLKNKATGAYLAAGNSWGTQAITNTQGGHRVGFEVLPLGKYKLNTYIYRDQSSTSALHYLNDNFCDGEAQEWQISDAGEGYYTLSNANGKLTGGDIDAAVSMTNGTGDNTKWQILTAAQRKAEIEGRMASATPASGVDATFYITAPGFAWADLADRAVWQGSPTFGGFDNGGSGRSWNAEKYTNPYATFDVYQALTGVKPGVYKLTAQGFYRNGLDNVSDANDNLAKLYANSTEVPLKNIRYYGYTDDTHSAEGFTENKSGYFVPNSQSDAAKAFNAEYYGNELYVVVGEDGHLRVGVKKTAATGADKDWAVFDNFKLTYYGNTVTATIGTTGWTTFASAYPLDLGSMSASEGTVTAYYASSVGDGKIVMTSTTSEGVAAGTGLMLKGTAGATVTIPVAASGDAISSNMLVGCTTETSVDANETCYVLINNGGNAEFQSLKTNGATIPAGKAYLNTGVNASSRLTIRLDGEDPTAINTIEAADTEDGSLKDGKYLIDNKIVLVKNGVKYGANGQKLN